MKPPKDQTPRECLFAQIYPNEEEDAEISVGLYRFHEKILLVARQERGGKIEVELTPKDARELLEALQQALKT